LTFFSNPSLFFFLIFFLYSPQSDPTVSCDLRCFFIGSLVNDSIVFFSPPFSVGFLRNIGSCVFFWMTRWSMGMLEFQPPPPITLAHTHKEPLISMIVSATVLVSSSFFKFLRSILICIFFRDYFSCQQLNRHSMLLVSQLAPTPRATSLILIALFYLQPRQPEFLLGLGGFENPGCFVITSPFYSWFWKSCLSLLHGVFLLEFRAPRTEFFFDSLFQRDVRVV